MLRRAEKRMQDRWGSARGVRKRAILLYVLFEGARTRAELLALFPAVAASEMSGCLTELVAEGFLDHAGWRAPYKPTDHALTILQG
jgi:hypothetical protein